MTPGEVETNDVLPGGPCSEADVYTRYLGIVGVAATPESGRAEMALDERHLNAVGRVHGGAIFSLADAAVALAANATADEVAVVTVSNIQYLQAAVPGERLVATAALEFRRRRRAGYRVRITRGNDLIALVSGETLVVS
jgi:phenylacetic acid degradation protein PaaD